MRIAERRACAGVEITGRKLAGRHCARARGVRKRWHELTVGRGLTAGKRPETHEDAAGHRKPRRSQQSRTGI